VHFVRGVACELLARGHEVTVFEPRDGDRREWGEAEASAHTLAEIARAFPGLTRKQYDPGAIDLSAVLENVDLVVVHEQTDPALVARIGAFRARTPRLRALFHDTHHRAVTDPRSMRAYDLGGYDGVLAAGRVIRDQYIDREWAPRAWTWHPAADTRRFRPVPGLERAGDLVWVGNWDDERSEELREFVIGPVRKLGLRARVCGAGYPAAMRDELALAGIQLAGYVPNHQVPRVLAGFRVTVDIPRRFLVERLPGIPTSRTLEALACGIPLVSSPWRDDDGLFTPGEDFLFARNGVEMARCLRAVVQDEELARELAASGRSRVLARHTCAHRADELVAVCDELGARTQPDRLPSRAPPGPVEVDHPHGEPV
jgi:spore maturation protein CgeB